MLSLKYSAAAFAALALIATIPAANAAAALTTASIKLFDGPVAGAELVTTLPANTKVGVLWCGMKQQWCLVSFHAKQGFVTADGLKLVAGKLADESGPGGNSQDPGKPGRRPASNAVLAETAAPPPSLGGNGPTSFQVVQQLHLVGK